MSKNERITENIVRELLKASKYFDTENGIVIEEQKSNIRRVQNLLKSASKAKTGKGGYPEFIISWDSDPNFIIIIECKADTKYHESKNLINQKIMLLMVPYITLNIYLRNILYWL